MKDDKGKGEQIRYERIRVKDIHAYACRMLGELKEKEELKENSELPVTRHRALSLKNNPYADDEDVGLIVAFDRDRSIGALVLMPGLLRSGGSLHKMFWTSSWFVCADYRGKGVGTGLLLEAVSLKEDIVHTAMSADSERVMKKHGFIEMAVLAYDVIHVDRVNPFTLPFRIIRKMPWGDKASREKIDRFTAGWNRITSPLIRRGFYRSLQLHRRMEESPYRFEVVDAFGEAVSAKGNCDNGKNEFYRDMDAVNWMLSYKWILENDERDPIESGYFFSSYRDRFRYVPMEIYSKESRTFEGYFVLSISSHNEKTTVKLLDHHFADELDRKAVFYSILGHARECLANTILLPRAFTDALGETWIKRLASYEMRRNYLCFPKAPESPLAKSMFDMDLHYQDSDLAFT